MAWTKISDYVDTVNYGEIIMTPTQHQNITIGELKKYLIGGSTTECKACGAPVQYNKKCEYCG
jgi:hypothetical protein